MTVSEEGCAQSAARSKAGPSQQAGSEHPQPQRRDGSRMSHNRPLKPDKDASWAAAPPRSSRVLSSPHNTGPRSTRGMENWICSQDKARGVSLLIFFGNASEMESGKCPAGLPRGGGGRREHRRGGQGKGWI